MKKLIGCINSLKAPIGLIKTRFFYLNTETAEVKDVTLELCEAIDKFNEKAKEVKATGAFSEVIPYDYKNGLAEYSFGCGLSHYLEKDHFEKIVALSENKLTFPLEECVISMYTPSDVKDILGCKNVFDSKITKALKDRYVVTA